MAHFNESSLEMAIMELFENEGYVYQNGKTIVKEETDVLLRDDYKKLMKNLRMKNVETQNFASLQTTQTQNITTQTQNITIQTQNIASV